MQLEKYVTDNSILIIPYNIKNKVIDYLNNLNTWINVKIMTFDELKKHLLFDYNEKTIDYLIKNYSLSYDNALDYLNNMYYLFDNEYEDSLLNKLKLIKDDLQSKDLLNFDKIFDKNKKIFIYGFDYLNRYQMKLLDNLNYEIIYKTITNYSHDILEFKSINDEVEHTANKIMNLKINLNNIYLTNVQKEYLSTIKKVFNFYNIPINLKSNTTLYDTVIGKNFFMNLDSIDDYLNNIQDSKIQDSIIDILNKYYWVDNFKDIKEMLIHEFQSCNIKTKLIKNAVNIIELNDNFVNDDDYIFLLGFNQSYIPKIFKDDDLISDNKKMDYLETTLEKNTIEKNNWLTRIHGIKNLIISYSKTNLSGISYPSSLCEHFNVTKMSYSASSYSNLSNQYNLALILDDYLKYSTTNNEMNKLIDTYPNLDYMTYSNQFTGLKYELSHLNLSYTKINAYYECSFKYYLDYVLKLIPYEETFDAYAGSLCHYILSNIYHEYDFNNLQTEYLKNNPFSFSEDNKVFLNKILEELKIAINFNLQQFKQTKYKNIICEENITVNKSDVIHINGIIDKIMSFENNNVLVDYKTGTPDIDLSYIPYGLNLQLPIYIYLIKKIHPESNIVGIYLQHIISPLINNNPSKDIISQKENNLKLIGYSIDDESKLNDFDSTYENSYYIKGMSMTSKGFSRFANILNKSQFDKLYDIAEEKINECINNVLDGNFIINPKIENQNNLSCTYCPYKSICFVQEQDYVDITSDKDLKFLGGEEND